MILAELKRDISNGRYDNEFDRLYGKSNVALLYQRERYLRALNNFSKLFPQRREADFYSAPGRTEIGGNHTEHQHGCVLAAAVNIDIIAVACPHNDGVIRIHSKGHGAAVVTLDNTAPLRDERGTFSAIVRGIAAGFAQRGVEIGGFDAYITSDIKSGSGLSYFAAFEVLIGTIINVCFNDGRYGATEIAKIGQFSEEVYFGKKSGLADQITSAAGGFVFMDFIKPDNPEIKQIHYDLEKSVCALYITDVETPQADYSEDISAITAEMTRIAECFGKSVLREIDEKHFLTSVYDLKKIRSDREILRAAHFFAENRAAIEETKALEEGDFTGFLKTVENSGNSSAKWLQNLYSNSAPDKQGATLALWASEVLCAGAARVHGSFGKAVQAFVPYEHATRYCDKMNRIFGENSCRELKIRQFGGICCSVLIDL